MHAIANCKCKPQIFKGKCLVETLRENKKNYRYDKIYDRIKNIYKILI